jgi:hypothetical protein
LGSFKYFCLINHRSRKDQIYKRASSYSVESVFFNSWSLGVKRGHNRVKHFYICFNGKNLLKSFKKALSQRSSHLLTRLSNAESSHGPGAVGAAI